jgi:4-diphosphocytidyl-2-C-methyl-D-erythritol kinase
VNFCDALEFVVSGDDTGDDQLTTTGLSLGVSKDDNIVIKAVRKLRERYSLPYLKLHLHKAIPHGAGLGGGSSDAACILKSLNRHFGLGIAEQEMRELALSIGSDCPFFLDCEPSYASGRGEVFDPINPVLEGYYLVLLNPGVGISTGEAYRNCRPAKPEISLKELAGIDLRGWKDKVLNDFEEYAFSVHPVIKEIKEAMYASGAVFSLMSGSGSSVYGLFKKKPEGLPSGFMQMIIWEGSM